MDGKNNNNDPLERLFQKKADEYNIPYREDDWLNLEKKLDIRDMQLAYRRKVRMLAAASVLILSLLGYFTYENHLRINEMNQQLSGLSGGEIEQTEPAETAITEREENLAGEFDPVERSDEIASDNDEMLTVEITSEQQPIIAEKAEAIDNMERYSDNFAGIVHISRETEIDINDVPSEYFNPERETIARAVTEKTNAFAAARSVPQTDRIWLASAKNNSHNDADPFLTFDSDQSRERSRISAALLASPDLSTAGALSNFDSPGFRFGLMAEYALSKNLALQAGAALGKVQYTATGNSYNPPGYWNRGVTPDKTSAVCLIFDIPVNLKYNFLNAGSSRFYATAGISSYIMLHEKYSFRYEQQDYRHEENFSEATGTRHWLSNAGFSVGYEIDMHENWSLRAEPYLKIPISGVGWGNTDLFSMGSLISLNYNFSR